MHFTDQIATYIKDNNLDLKHLTIVLPSERAKKYISASLFKAYLGVYPQLFKNITIKKNGINFLILIILNNYIY